MIGVLTASTTSGSVLGYDLGDLKNKDQKIRILSFEGVFLDARQVDRLNQNWTDESSRKEFKYISRSVANDLAHQFDSQASMNDRIVRTTGHISLSFSPADLPKLDDESMVKYAEEYMERMGIVDTQYVITRHFETNAPHLHIAYNRVKYDGTVIDSKNERYRSQKVAAEISKKYDLAVAGDSPRLEESLSPQQQLFSQMRTLAREALAQSCTMEAFKKNLRDRGISLRVSEHSENQKSYGLSFSMIEHPEVSAKGSKLDRSALSYAKVTATLAQNLANRVAVESQLAAEQKQNKITELSAAYSRMVSILKKLIDITLDLFQLYTYTKMAGISISAETRCKYRELQRSFDKLRQLNHDLREALDVERFSLILAFAIPYIGLLIYLITMIITDIRISEIKSKKKELLTKIEGLKSDIDDLQLMKELDWLEKQERLNIYLQAKGVRNEFREAMEKIKSGIQQLKEQTRSKIDLSKIDFAAMGRKAAAQRLVTPTTTSLSGSSKDVQSKTQFDLYSLILSAKDKKSLERDLNSKLSVMKSLKDSVGGVTDFEITLAREGRVTTASSLFSEEQMRKVFNKWEALTGEKPAYSLETERTNRRQPEDIHRKIETVSPQNRFEQSKGGGPTKKR